MRVTPGFAVHERAKRHAIETGASKTEGIGLGRIPSLRRHDPDQVLRVLHPLPDRSQLRARSAPRQVTM